MRDIAYFRTSIPPEAGDGPVGWAVAEALTQALRDRGLETSSVRPSWDGVKWECRVDGYRFELEVTPYFEATPLEWSVQLRPVGVWRYLPSWSRSSHERLCEIIDSTLVSTERF